MWVNVWRKDEEGTIGKIEVFPIVNPKCKWFITEFTIYIYIYIHTYIYIYIHTYLHTYIHTYIYIYIYLHTHSYIIVPLVEQGVLACSPHRSNTFHQGPGDFLCCVKGCTLHDIRMIAMNMMVSNPKKIGTVILNQHL